MVNHLNYVFTLLFLLFGSPTRFPPGSMGTANRTTRSILVGLTWWWTGFRLDHHRFTVDLDLFQIECFTSQNRFYKVNECRGLGNDHMMMMMMMMREFLR